jgi:hypothetical protein
VPAFDRVRDRLRAARKTFVDFRTGNFYSLVTQSLPAAVYCKCLQSSIDFIIQFSGRQDSHWPLPQIFRSS